VTSTPFEFIPVKTFEHNLKFYQRDKDRIKTKIEEMLAQNPYRYEMLKGEITVAGVNLAGLRHMKTGVSGRRGGVYVLYRICEECKKNQYMIRGSGKACEFCDDKKWRHVVLFNVRPRSAGY